jgi:hypothetical protein
MLKSMHIVDLSKRIYVIKEAILYQSSTLPVNVFELSRCNEAKDGSGNWTVGYVLETISPLQQNKCFL